ncbi:MAG: Inner membrane protein YbaN [Bacteroidetes bacterium ADurb.Bin217]|nr:MAG: Inner membrane protein YbaN [Bacteroidetes bacterium ADurb.Bin217]
MDIKKITYFILGIICLILAYIGVILPGIPGTPFVLFTAFFFIRSSPKMQQWIMKQKVFSKIIQKFEEKPILPLKLKLLLLFPILSSIAIAVLFYIESNTNKYICIGIAIIVIILILRIKKISISKN